MTKEQTDIVRAHFARFPNPDPCPNCHGKSFAVIGPLSTCDGAAFGMFPTRDRAEVVAAACADCGYLRFFSWGIIVAAAKEEPAAAPRTAPAGAPHGSPSNT